MEVIIESARLIFNPDNQRSPISKINQIEIARNWIDILDRLMGNFA